MNPYTYCNNQPTKLIDKDGKFAFLAALLALGVASKLIIGAAAGLAADITIKNQVFKQSGYTKTEAAVAAGTGLITAGGSIGVGAAVVGNSAKAVATRAILNAGVNMLTGAVMDQVQNKSTTTKANNVRFITGFGGSVVGDVTASFAPKVNHIISGETDIPYTGNLFDPQSTINMLTGAQAYGLETAKTAIQAISSTSSSSLSNIPSEKEENTD